MNKLSMLSNKEFFEILPEAVQNSPWIIEALERDNRNRDRAEAISGRIGFALKEERLFSRRSLRCILEAGLAAYDEKTKRMDSKKEKRIQDYIEELKKYSLAMEKEEQLILQKMLEFAQAIESIQIKRQDQENKYNKALGIPEINFQAADNFYSREDYF